MASVGGTLVTAFSIAHDGFAAAQSVSRFQTVVRLAAVLAALYLWQFSRDAVDKATLACWIIAATSSALYYGAGMNTTTLHLVRAFSHLLAYAFSAIVLTRLLLGFRAEASGRHVAP
jgi:hypothetical protein